MATVEDIACRQYAEFVTSYLEGQLDPPKTGWFEQHQLVCEGCARYLEQMRTTVRLLTGRDEGRSVVPRMDRAPLAGGVSAYKFLKKDGTAPFSGFVWQQRVWVRAEGTPRACSRGIHACRVEDLPYWLGEESCGALSLPNRSCAAPTSSSPRPVDSPNV